MGTGWRRAFCTSIRREPETTAASEKQQSPSPRSCSSLGIFSGGSNPSTPRLRCRTEAVNPPPPAEVSPRLQCKTTKSPRLFQASNPSSPKSPSRFALALFKTSLRFSRSSCGICMQSIKTGQGTAIFTAECAHSFHFPCIAAHVRKEGNLVCPVCSTTWKDAPLLAIHKNQPRQQPPEEELIINSPDPVVKEIKGEKKPRSDSNSKLYDDDEPLMSPKRSPFNFNPIPEVDDENEGDDVVEFQGFFANPSKPSKGGATYGGDSKKVVETVLLPEAAVVSMGRSYQGFAVVLKVKAPPPARVSTAAAPLLDPARRAPIDLVTVLDVSGSMTGAKLQMLKRAMRLVVGSLGSSDRLSIVAFSASAKRLMPLTRMSSHGQRSARRIIDRLVCAQGTCVGDALRKATKVLEDRRERNPVASIMLLSDGQDERVSSNAGNRRRPASHVSSTRFAHLEIPVHAFGFGQQQQTHVPVEDAFAKCVGGLLSVVVQDLRLQLGFSSGSAPAEISAVYSTNGRPSFIGAGSIRLGDLYAEEERELVVEVRVPPSAIGAHHVMSVRCSYRDPATQEHVACKDQALLLPRPHAVRSSEPRIERLRNLFIATKAVAEARRQADQACAHHMLSSARALLLQSSLISADENIRILDAEIAEMHYRRQQQQIQRRRIPDQDESGEPLTPTSAWRAAEQLAKVAIMRKSLNRVSDLHGFENARF
eukprot:TRINITY_DN2840_c1_g1_i5.p1 TRINITY_DN2840_c1_g1~~TRINITY_DN2840_c1_g1_i5.p1  ORF type:complete len:708 (+),score=61.69 TRINITY_DN2840_c1_g1_i5:902-3025(+)